MAEAQIPHGYKETEVGVIPEDWEIRTLEQLGSWRGGATPSMQNSAFWANGTIPWVSSGDVKSVSMSDAPMQITEYAVRNSSTTVLPTDSIIIVVRSGILRKYLPVARTTRTLAINQDIKALIPATILVPSYLLYLLTWSGPKILATCLKSGTTVESIEFRWLKSFRLPLPPTKAEQEAIAEALSDADALIESLEQLIAKKRQIKQGAMQELLTGKKRLPGFATKPACAQTEVGVIPEDWELRELGDIASVAAGGTPSRENPAYWNGNIPWVTTSQIDFNTITSAEQYITELGLKNSATKLLAPGTLLLALYGQGKTRGKVGILGLQATTNQACASIVISSLISSRFVFHFLANQYDAIRGLSNSGSQENLTGQIVKSLLIPLPHTLAEQEAITTILTEMDAEIVALEAKLAKARQLKQGMMQELLTGRTRLV